MVIVKPRIVIFIFAFFLQLTSSSLLSQNICKKIILIGVTRSDRQDFGKLLKKVQDAGPQAISIDIIFNGDEESSSKLRSQMGRVNPPKILSTRLDDFGDGRVFLIGSDPTVVPHECQTGFINVISINDFVETAEKFQVFSSTDINPDPEYHMAIRIAMNLDSAKSDRFIQSRSDTVAIDYNEGKRSFKRFDMDELLNDAIPLKQLQGKVIIIGFVDPELQLIIPVVDRRTGVRIRMDRIEVLANIVAQIFAE